MTSRLARLALPVLAGLVAMAALAGPASARAQRAHRTPAAKVEASVLAAINEVRAEHGLGPVRPEGRLARAARSHSSDMLARDYFLHESGPEGASFDERVYGFFANRKRPHAIGEILYWGAGDAGAVDDAVRGWLNSAPHRAVLLDGSYTQVGIGLGHGRFSGARAATVYTVDFSRP